MESAHQTNAELSDPFQTKIELFRFFSDYQIETFLLQEWSQCFKVKCTEQKYKRNTFVFTPIFHVLNSKI